MDALLANLARAYALYLRSKAGGYGQTTRDAVMDTYDNALMAIMDYRVDHGMTRTTKRVAAAR